MSTFENFAELVNSKGEFNKEEFLEALPDWLKYKDCERRQKHIRKLKDTVTKKEIIQFLKVQTMGRDYKHLDLIVKYYDVAYDNNDMIIFNNDLSITELKAESLFIFWMLRLLKKDPFISQYPRFTKSVLQENFDEGIRDILGNDMKIDLLFICLKIMIEIDEPHHEQPAQILRDDMKNARCQVNGFAFLRLKYYEIINYAKEHKISVNEAIYNSNILAKFKEDFLLLVKQSLMQFLNARRGFVMLRLLKVFINDLHFVKTECIKYKEKLDKLLRKLYKNSKDKDLIEEYETTRDIYINLCKNHRKLNNICDDMSISRGSTVTSIFEFKHRAKEGNEYVVSLREAMEVFKLSYDEENIKLFKKHLLGLGFVRDNNFDGYILTWSEFTEAVFEWDQDLLVKNVLHKYCIEIEKSYEIIIRDLNEFIRKSKSSQEHVVTYTNYIKKKINDHYQKEINSLKYDLKHSDNQNKLKDKEIGKMKKMLYGDNKVRKNMDDYDFPDVDLDIYKDDPNILSYEELERFSELTIKDIKKNKYTSLSKIFN